VLEKQTGEGGSERIVGGGGGQEKKKCGKPVWDDWIGSTWDQILPRKGVLDCHARGKKASHNERKWWSFWKDAPYKNLKKKHEGWEGGKR